MEQQATQHLPQGLSLGVIGFFDSVNNDKDNRGERKHGKTV
jgi:hypothetical protein